jgi:hypothetical protein
VSIVRNLQELLLDGAPLPLPGATRSATTAVSSSFSCSSARADAEFCSICYCEEDISSTRKQAELVTCSNRRCHHMYHSDCLRGWLHASGSCKVSFGIVFGTCPYCSTSIEVAAS